MKKMFSMAAALLLTAGVYATDSDWTEISSKAATSFEKIFPGATEVSWYKKGDFYFASFQLNSNGGEAAFNEQGELIGMSKLIRTTEIPMNVSIALLGKYPGWEQAKITTEVTFENQTNYYINVANDQEVLKLKCSGAGEISVESKIKR